MLVAVTGVPAHTAWPALSPLFPLSGGEGHAAPAQKRIVWQSGLASHRPRRAQGENTEVNVKRLPNKPTPPRFGRKLTSAQRDRATHICLDCGYIYCDQCAP
jgi:hypothetical protein